MIWLNHFSCCLLSKNFILFIDFFFLKERWDDVISFNPAGLTSKRPTIAATYARMDIPELQLVPDGQVSLFLILNLIFIAANIFWGKKKLIKFWTSLFGVDCARRQERQRHQSGY